MKQKSSPSFSSRFAFPRFLYAASFCLGVLTLQAQQPSTTTPANRPDASGVGRSSADGSMSTSGNSRTTGSSSLKRADRRFLIKASEDGHQEMALAQLASEKAENAEVRTFAQQMISDHQKMDQDLMSLAQQKNVTLESLHASSHAAGNSSSYDSTSDAHRSSGVVSSSASGSSAMGGGSADMAGAGNSDLASGSSGSAKTSGDTMTGSMDHGSRWSEMFGSERHYHRLSKETGREFDAEFVDMMVDDHEDTVKLFEKTSREATDPDVAAFANKNLPSLRAHLDQARSLAKNFH